MQNTLTKSLSVLAFIACAQPFVSQAQLTISEVHPTGSSSSTYAADWFELRNTGPLALDITGWRVDDNSAAFTNSLALRGVGSIAPGQVVVFMESSADGSTDAAKGAAFESAWFGGSTPPGFTLGYYGGSSIGLGSGGDAVNIYDSVGALLASVNFGAATTGVTFDNAAGLSGLISQLSVVGVNGTFNSVAGSEVGSPGVVPEPSSLALGALGVATLICRRSLTVRR